MRDSLRTVRTAQRVSVRVCVRASVRKQTLGDHPNFYITKKKATRALLLLRYMDLEKPGKKHFKLVF